MRCSYCNFESEKEMKFCYSCGKKIVAESNQQMQPQQNQQMQPQSNQQVYYNQGLDHNNSSSQKIDIKPILEENMVKIKDVSKELNKKLIDTSLQSKNKIQQFLQTYKEKCKLTMDRTLEKNMRTYKSVLKEEMVNEIVESTEDRFFKYEILIILKNMYAIPTGRITKIFSGNKIIRNIFWPPYKYGFLRYIHIFFLSFITSLFITPLIKKILIYIIVIFLLNYLLCLVHLYYFAKRKIS